MTLFFRLVDVEVSEKSENLLGAIRAGTKTFEATAEQLGSIPGTPFAYWIGDAVRDLFRTAARFESDGRIARKGLTTSDDDRYVRVWWEVSPVRLGSRWANYAKGGEAMAFYADVHCVVRWSWEQRTIPGYVGRAGRESETVECADLMGRPSLTWPLRAASFTPSILPRGCVFSARGYVIQAEQADLPWVLGLTASAAFDYLFKTCLGRTGHPEFVVGVLQNLPVPELPALSRAMLAEKALEAWSIQKGQNSTSEISHSFILPRSSRERLGLLAAGEAHSRLADLNAELSTFAARAYGLDERLLAGEEFSEQELEASGREIEGEEDSASVILQGMEDTFLSWSMGIAFARFDIRLATGEHAAPPEPEPFDPLPAKSPGMLPDGVAPFRPTSGVFVDDPGHADDLGARVTAVYERVGETPPAPDELRRMLARDFFPAHIRMYSKSRRKAPIYWQLATPSASYSVWLYIHVFNNDTLFRVLNDYVTPKLTYERRELEGLLSESGATPTSIQSRTIEKKAAFVEELSALQDEVKRVAPLWAPDLDDGVIINFAPLWRLTPQNRTWQKELRATWASLCEGDYDWSRLAMRLWPERVVSKCGTDRSLAIAHDLEDVFWYQGADSKWQARPAPTQPIAKLVAERTSAAVKAALSSLNEAPTPATGVRRGGRKSN